MMPSASRSSHVWLAAAWLLAIGSLCVEVQAQSDLDLSDRSRFGFRSNVPTGAAATRKTPPLKPAPRPVGDPRLAALDPSTRVLVETELRDAAPAEREHWLQLVTQVSPDQIPYLLSARRRAASAQGASPQAPAVGAPDPGVVQRPAVYAPVAPINHSEFETESSQPAGNEIRPATAAPLPGDPDAAHGEPLPDAPSAAPPHRRWMSLRGRRGENRGTEESAQPAVAAPPVDPPQPDSSRATALRSTAYMNVELQRVMTLLRTELLEAEQSGLSPDDPAYRRLHVQMRLLHLLADEPEQALQAIPNLAPEQQEFWTQFLWALANELDARLPSTEVDRLERTSDLLTAAQRHLDRSAPLQIEKAVFCHRINGFGDYESFTQPRFQPGQPLLIYAEIRNFQSELTPDNRYRTRMRTVIEILPAGPRGEPVPTAVPLDRREFPATEDVSRSLRQDFFHSYRIDLPPQLVAGNYVLRLTLTDEFADKSDVAWQGFVIP